MRRKEGDLLKSAREFIETSKHNLNLTDLMRNYEDVLNNSLRHYSLDYLEDKLYEQIKNSCLDLYLAVDCVEKSYNLCLELVFNRHNILNLSPKEGEKLKLSEHNIYTICRSLKMISYLFAKEEASKSASSLSDRIDEAMAKQGLISLTSKPK